MDNLGIYTKKHHHLVKAALSVTKLGRQLKKAWRLMLMEQHSLPRLICHVDRKRVLVQADTGAETDVASLAYARAGGWHVTPYADDEGFLVLADEEVVKVAGYADRWLRIGGTRARKRFQILDGLPGDFILGDETLEAFRVFTDHQDALVHGRGPQADDAFCMMQWVERFAEEKEQLDELLGETVAGGAGASANVAGMTGQKSNKAPLSAQALRLRLRRRLEGLESIEADCHASTAECLGSLTGDALIREEESDQNRRERYLQLRRRILEELARLPAPDQDPPPDTAAAPKASRIRRFWSRSRGGGNIRP